MSKARPDKAAWVRYTRTITGLTRFWINPGARTVLLPTAGSSVLTTPVSRNILDSPADGPIEPTSRAWLQTVKVDVIANVQLSGAGSIPYALAGIPHGSTLAIGLSGCTKQENQGT